MYRWNPIEREMSITVRGVYSELCDSHPHTVLGSINPSYSAYSRL